MSAGLCRNGHAMTDENVKTIVRFRAEKGHTKERQCQRCLRDRMDRLNLQRQLAREVDDIVVERLVSGQHSGSSTTEERRIATDILTKRGFSINQTARLIGCSGRQVMRYRNYLKGTE